MNNAKDIYPPLWARRWPDPMGFLSAFSSKEELVIGGLRDFACEILAHDPHWSWLGRRVDDFAGLVENSMTGKIQKWIWRSYFDIGALAGRLSDTETTAKWLMDRYVAELRNLFDLRYKNSLNIRDIHIVSIDNYYGAMMESDAIYG